MNYCQLLIAFLKIRINFQNWNICKSRNDNNSKPSRAEKFFFFLYFLLLLLLLKCLLRNKQTKISAEATKCFLFCCFFRWRHPFDHVVFKAFFKRINDCRYHFKYATIYRGLTFSCSSLIFFFILSFFLIQFFNILVILYSFFKDSIKTYFWVMLFVLRICYGKIFMIGQEWVTVFVIFRSVALCRVLN